MVRARASAALALLIAAGCREPAPAPAAITFRDPDGAPVTMDALPVDRVVSTMQSATEWIVALGASQVLVARTDFDRQPELAALPSVGGGLDRVRLPCFRFDERVGVLPAFGAFTGMHGVRREPGRRLFAVLADERVVELP